MNRPLRRIALALAVLFGLLLVNLNYLQAVRARELNTMPGNSRVLLQQYGRERGPILVAGSPVASSTETDDALKYLRQYRDGELYAPATGYYSPVYGAAGIEREEDPVLAGTDDRLFVRRAIDTLTGKDPKGGSVALTLDPAAQQAAYAGLQATPDKRGAVVAIEPATGRILALVSSPSYDPGVLASHDTDRDTAAYRRLDGDPTKPLLNRALRQTYPPGSTFKLITAATALSTGRYTPDTVIPGPARLPLPDTRISLPNFDVRQCTAGSDKTTLLHALERSCNTGFASVGLAVGADALREQARKFGFATTPEVPMPAAPSVFPDTVNRPQTALSAIGQYDVRATPLQMAMVGAGIANGGVVMRPYLVDQVLGPDLAVLADSRPRPLSTAVSPQVAQQLTAMMVSVVDNGTATNGRIPGVSVAAKTGTAQQAKSRPPHAWFVSFAPAEAPKIAVAVVVEDGGGVRRQEIGGNRVAAPIARSVMEAVLRR